MQDEDAGAHLHNLLARVAGLQIAVRVGGAVATLVDALRLALLRATVRHRADPQDEVRREAGPVVLLQLLGSRHKLLQMRPRIAVRHALAGTLGFGPTHS